MKAQSLHLEGRILRNEPLKEALMEPDIRSGLYEKKNTALEAHLLPRVNDDDPTIQERDFGTWKIAELTSNGQKTRTAEYAHYKSQRGIQEREKHR